MEWPENRLGGKGSAGVHSPPQMAQVALLGLARECVGLSWAVTLVLLMWRLNHLTSLVQAPWL